MLSPYASSVGAALPMQATAASPNYDFSPTGTATIPAGETRALDYRGQSGGLFAFDRILCGGDLEQVTATAATNQGRTVLFNDVHLSALRDLTLFRRLKGLLYIPESDKLALTLTNRSDQAATVNVQLAGYSDEAAIQRQEQCLASAHGGQMPSVELVTAYAELPAGSAEVKLDMSRSFPVSFRRFFLGAARLEDARVQLKIFQDTVKQKVYAAQLRDEYLWHEAARPYVLDPSTPLSVLVDNQGAEVLPASVIFEAYATS